MTELLPCPFCGSEASLCEHKTNEGNRWRYDGVHGYIQCSNEECFMCDSLNPFWFDEAEENRKLQDVIKLWNTRILPKTRERLPYDNMMGSEG